ncbi:tetratricopeptide repeat protein [Tenacibaculum sp. SG-28]|uniref:tetratricopeptide repeat-containing sensor histidine kinase n=1 Tax=Tenacibaculum sp. SG-28 TaxID=754426 RepID=UPI000CF51C53|nr:tetratricopeptide repeat protein [Tenacibaculum sp. SG-28]PQJ21651.1 hypothetical protein BSU00_06035 [Tenacibaculum sp. SG-28]
MKGFLYTLLFFLSFSFAFGKEYSQQDPSVINDFLYINYNNFYQVKSFFRQYDLDESSINLLLSKSKVTSNDFGQIYAYNFLGRLNRTNLLYEDALTYHFKALEISRKEKLVFAEIVTLNQIAVVYRRQDKIRRALNYHQYALDLISKYKLKTIDLKKSKVIAESGIANIYMDLQQYPLALEKFTKILEIQTELQDNRGLAIVHQSIGVVHQNLDDLDKALKHYFESLNYNTEIGSDLGKIICHNRISSVLILKGQFNEALRFISEVKEASQKLGNNYYRSLVGNTLGYSLLKVGAIDSAQVTIENALTVALKYNIADNVSQSYEYLSEVYRERQDFENAYVYYEKSVKGKNDKINSQNSAYVNNLINWFDDEVKTNQKRSLGKENEITKLKLTQNRNVLTIALVSIALFGVLLYAFYGQRLLNNEKKILMLEQEALQTQMNPHFVFNALNSIKLYIINNEQKNAVYYLNKFSKLIRSILESSKAKEISLSEELKTMDIYMSIENIRFLNEIQYTESIDETINLDKIKVPPLILQPFLENAIWHGLSSKKGEKKVALAVTKIGSGFIKITITDNGIGREEALKIKNSKSLQRESIGIELTKQRLQIFSYEFENKFFLEYTDLYDDANMPMVPRLL